MIDNYYKPTPAPIRKVADTLFFVSQAVTVGGIASWHPAIALAAAIAATLSKAFNFFADQRGIQ